MNVPLAFKAFGWSVAPILIGTPGVLFTLVVRHRLNLL